MSVDPLLPETTSDEHDPNDSGSDQWRDGEQADDERFLREVPPHHG
ncbi:MAG: hypothetical protein WCL12_04220 [Actinomycetes bacterium]